MKLFLCFIRRFLVSFLRMLVSFLRVLHGLPGQLVSAQVIAFFVMGGGSPVGMRGKFVEFGSSSMGIARHTLILAPGPRADAWVINQASARGMAGATPSALLRTYRRK